MCPEALFGLQFLNPYLKSSSEHSYSEIHDIFMQLSASEKNSFLEEVTGSVKRYKDKILKQNKDRKAREIMPLMLTVMWLITYYLCKGKLS